MRIPLAVAFTLSVGLVPANGQSMSDNYSSVTTPPQSAVFAPFGPFVVPQPGARRSRNGSVSRACLSAQTRAVLAQLEARFGGVQVISTCRPGAVIAGSGRPSMHRYGRAVDFRPAAPGQRGPMLAWLRANAGGSVLTYRSGHIHFDTGGYTAGARRSYARSR